MTEKAIAWLVVGLINEHFPHPDEVEEDPVMGTPGCVIRCGHCGALWELSSSAEGRSMVERMVRLTGFQEGGWSYWDTARDRLRWDWFRDWWARHKGCSSSNGVVNACDFDDEDAVELHLEPVTPAVLEIAAAATRHFPNPDVSVELVDDEHAYVSTACQHGLHGRCRLVCKFCEVACGCSCGHPAQPTTSEE